MAESERKSGRLEEEIRSIGDFLFFVNFLAALFVGFFLLGFVLFFSWFFFFGILRMVTSLTIEKAIINAFLISIAVWAAILYRTFRRKRKE